MTGLQPELWFVQPNGPTITFVPIVCVYSLHAPIEQSVLQGNQPLVLNIGNQNASEHTSSLNDVPLLDPPSSMTALKPELLLSLPDEHTVAIFSLLPLQQLIVNVPLVHRRLEPIRENVLKDIQRLALHIGDQKEIKKIKIGSRFALPFSHNTEPLCFDTYWSDLDQLRLATLDYRSVEQLSTLMPAIVHLQVVISHTCVSVLQQLTILLAHWAPTLQTLQLNIGQLFFNERLIGEPLYILTSNLRLLLQAINRKFVALQHLTLDIGNLIDDAQFVDEFFFGGKTGVPLSLSIFGQQKEFWLHLGKCANGQSLLLTALKKYATKCLTSIRLNGVRLENVIDLTNSLTNAFKGKQRLVLYIGDQQKIKKTRFARNTEPFCSELNQLHLTTLDYRAVDQLSTLMPGIVDLQMVISHACLTVLPQLTILLAHWAPTLRTLQLTIGDLYFIERLGLIREPLYILTSNMRSLIQALNRKFVALQHLTLDIGKLIDDAQFVDEFPFGGKTGDPLSLPILGQLREFNLHLGKCANGQSFLSEALQKHASKKLTSIRLNGVRFENVNALANNSSSTLTGLKPELLLSLPDVPTLAILSLLPLQQLIVNLPLVHRRLEPIRQSVLKSIQRLVLHIGDQKEIKKLLIDSPLRVPFVSHVINSTGALLYPETDTLSSTLHLSTLDDQSVEQLTSLMPSIVHLQVAISHAPSSILNPLASLLTHWAPTLQELTVTSGALYIAKSNKAGVINWKEAASSPIGNSEETTVFRSFIQFINDNLRALQHLTLDIGKDLLLNSDEFLEQSQTRVSLRLSILGQLREFYLNMAICQSAPDFLLDQLTQYASKKLTTIGLGGAFKWDLIGVAKSQFARRFIIVPFNDSPTSYHIPFLQSFSNLTVYGFNWQQLTNEALTANLYALSSLSHLQYLKVNSFAPVSHPPLSLLSLRWLTLLDISISGTHQHLQAPYLATLFPSVQILKVTHVGPFCTICYPDEDLDAREKITDFTEVGTCLKQLFAPLAVLPSLRKIFYQRANQFDSVAEFTPKGEFVRTYEYIC